MRRDPNRRSTHYYGDGCDPPHKADQACNSYTVNAPMLDGNDQSRFVPLLCVYCGHGPGEHR